MRPSMRHLYPMILGSVLVAVGGCGSSDAGTPGSPAAISLSTSPTSASVQQGATTQVTGTIVRSGGFTGDVAISMINAPTGVTAALSGPIAAGSSTGVATLSVPSSTPVGVYTITIQASGTGVTTATAPFTLTVTAAPPAGDFSLVAAPATLSMNQGASSFTGIKATRTNGLSAPITLTSSGAPTGLTIAFGTTAVADSSSITATATSGLAAGSYPVVITGTSGTLVHTTNITVTVIALPVGDFSLVAAPLTMNVTQGSSNSTGVKAVRINGLSAPITYTQTGAPAGLTIAFGTTSVTDSSSITATATGALAAGAYPIVITGTSGTLTHTANITVTVLAAIRLDFSACAINARPIWVATQDGITAWTRVSGTGDVYLIPTFSSGKGGVAFVTSAPSGGGQVFNTFVKYVATSDIPNIVPCATAAPAGRTVNGSISNAGSRAAAIAYGPGGTVLATAAAPTFQLTNVPAGTYDVLSFLAALTGPQAGDPIIIRRDVDVADGGTIPVLNFAGPEVTNSVSALITVTGGGAANYTGSMRYFTRATCVSDSFTFNNTAFPSPLTFYGVSPAAQRATDFHNLILEQNNSNADYRAVTTTVHTMANQTIAIGSGVGVVTYTTLPGSYLRLQGAITLAPEYKTASMNFATVGTNTQIFTVDQTAAYIGGTSVVALAAPDLSTVSGWLAAWGPSTSGAHSSSVSVASTAPATLCAEGATTRTARSSVGLGALRTR